KTPPPVRVPPTSSGTGPLHSGSSAQDAAADGHRRVSRCAMKGYAMTPNTSSAPSRRSFLASTAVAAPVIGGGAPLLTACGAADSGSDGGSSAGKGAQKMLPTYVANNVVTPDIPAKNGSAAGFTGKLDLATLKTSVPQKLGKGGKVTVMAPFWGS